MRRTLSRKAFTAWLKRQKKGDGMECGNPKLCPLALFFGPGASVNGYEFSYRDELKEHPLPEWAVRFVDEFDHVGVSTREGALAALKRSARREQA